MLHVLVADTRTVRVFEPLHSRKVLVEVVVFRNDAAGRHERDLVSDRPGRVIGTFGRHQSYEATVPASQHVLTRWLKAVGHALQEVLDARSNDGLILVASARTLALLRKSLPQALRSRIRAEVARDLVRAPIRNLTTRLQPVLRSVESGKLRSRLLSTAAASRRTA